jgi:NADH dehydrogenase FAD-containing subunit
VIACIGFKPIIGPVQKGLPDCIVDGYVNVNTNCQVGNFDHVFAIGDITSFKEEKLAISAEMHADVVLKNITKLITGQPLVNYSPSSKRPMV